MDLKIFTDNIEEKALQQINTLMEQPAFADCKVRIMPDVHAGAGCVIGFTADLGNKVIPYVIGVDLNCGLLTTSLGKIGIDFDKLDQVIRKRIPSGQNVHDSVRFEVNEINALICGNYLKNRDWLERSMGTLGGGNHFIEIDQGEDGNKYLVIHTGSRNLGKQVADHYQNVAIERINRNNAELKSKVNQAIRELKEQGCANEIEQTIKEIRNSYVGTEKMPNELCYLEGMDRMNYLNDMLICQWFATRNRNTIADIICEEMGWSVVDRFETVHNYIDLETNIVRKGAISAKKGERVLIPMNMRDGCIIGIGKGNEDWNCSAPHGAGRIMSRAQAKKNIPIATYRASMDGIWSSTVTEKTLDESPMAYKPMDEILKYIKPTIDVERIIKSVYNFKAAE